MTREEKISSPPSCLLVNSILVVQLVPAVHKTLRFFSWLLFQRNLLPACDVLVFYFEQYSKISRHMNNHRQQTLYYLIQEQAIF